MLYTELFILTSSFLSHVWKSDVVNEWIKYDVTELFHDDNLLGINDVQLPPVLNNFLKSRSEMGCVVFSTKGIFGKYLHYILQRNRAWF